MIAKRAIETRSLTILQNLRGLKDVVSTDCNGVWVNSDVCQCFFYEGKDENDVCRKGDQNTQNAGIP